MNRIVILGSLLLFFHGLNVISQVNFQPALILTKTNDSIQGYIDYRNWDKNPLFISFKKSDTNDISVLSPKDILAFKVGGDFYISATVKTEGSSVIVGDLDNKPNLKITEAVVFLLNIYDGPKSLFLYKRSDNIVNYYIKSDTAYNLLIYKKYMKVKEGINVITENKTFIGQLKIYLEDCQSIQSKLDKISYSQNDLIKIFNYYTKCTQPGMVREQKTNKIKAEFGLFTGLTLSTLKFKSIVIDYYIADYKPSMNFTGGVFCNLVLPRNLSKFSISNELQYTQYAFNTINEDYSNNLDYTNTTIDLQFAVIKLNTLLLYKYPIKKLYVCINAGIINGYNIAQKNQKKTERVFYNVHETKIDKALSDIRKHEQGYMFGMGAVYKKFSFETRFEKTNGMSPFSATKSSITRYNFLLGYQF